MRRSNLNTGTKVLQDYTSIFRHQRAATSAVSGGNTPKFKCIQTFMIYAKKGEDPSKKEGARIADDISPLISLWEFLQTLKGS